jgi:hypothetical protein
LKLASLVGDGSSARAAGVDYVDGKYVIDMPVRGGTHWFILSE